MLYLNGCAVHGIPFLPQLCCQSPEKPRSSKLDHSCGFLFLGHGGLVCSMHAIPWTQKSCKSWRDTNKNICIAPCSKSLLAQGPGQNLFPSPIVCLTASKDTPVYRGVCCYVPISSSVFSAHSNLPARPASPGARNRGLGPGLSSVESCPRWREDTHTNTGEMVARRRRENCLYTQTKYCSDGVQ